MTSATDTTSHFTHATTSYWQTILPADDTLMDSRSPVYRYSYPAPLPDKRRLALPIRAIPGTNRAVASLIANQASFQVIDALASFMTPMAASFEADIIVGLPTLGLAFAPTVASRLGHDNFVPLGYSEKFWYSKELSVPVRSITSPGGGKLLYIDPNILPRLAGKRVVVVDDAVSSGTTTAAACMLLAKLDCTICGIVVAMRQGVSWRDKLDATKPGHAALVKSPLAGPLFERVTDGWAPITGTLDRG